MVGVEVEKTTVFAPNNAKLISVALSGIPMSSAVLSLLSALSADELLGRTDGVKDVVGIANDGPLRVDSVADRVALPLREDVTGLGWLMISSSTWSVPKALTSLSA